ncbi:alpha/beta hydrolase [Paenibacillus pasadenensis]|uniref:alpha/beta fold hydrolase n=1 Tax=Paenibacillus pasadenensis TaxID=217090 RepID=UPI0020413C94|nr:alpha/beta hydrolase [Paenibacillus pasadenensis]MCM3748417.1 alpha/beta hydrolase [Paenibacillus pasadenensis]
MTHVYRSSKETERLNFVLIHGSWADASYWQETSAELQRMGHTVYVPEYPGHGGDNNPNVTQAQITQAVADYITSRNLKDIILVGHSFGGTIVQTTSQLIPDRVKRNVFMNAFVLQDGQTLADQLPPPTVEAFKQLTQASGNNTIMLPYGLFRETFANLADGPLAQYLYSRMLPEPAGPLFEKLNLSRFYSLPIPRSYLYLTTDGVLPQGEGYGWHPHMSLRLGVFRLIKAPGDHMSTVKTNPGLIARKLVEAARD